MNNALKVDDRFYIHKTEAGLELAIKNPMMFSDIVRELMTAHDEHPIDSSDVLRFNDPNVEAVIIGPKNYFKGYVLRNGVVKKVVAHIDMTDGLKHIFEDVDNQLYAAGIRYTLVRADHLDED